VVPSCGGAHPTVWLRVTHLRAGSAATARITQHPAGHDAATAGHSGQERAFLGHVSDSHPETVTTTHETTLIRKTRVRLHKVVKRRVPSTSGIESITLTNGDSKTCMPRRKHTTSTIAAHNVEPHSNHAGTVGPLRTAMNTTVHSRLRVIPSRELLLVRIAHGEIVARTCDRPCLDAVRAYVRNRAPKAALGRERCLDSGEHIRRGGAPREPRWSRAGRFHEGIQQTMDSPGRAASAIKAHALDWRVVDAPAEFTSAGGSAGKRPREPRPYGRELPCLRFSIETPRARGRPRPARRVRLMATTRTECRAPTRARREHRARSV
jgi:hypothetical protein